MRFFLIEFDATHPDEFTGRTVIEAEEEPTSGEAENVIAIHGCIYVNEITEITVQEVNKTAPMRLIHLS